MIEFVLFRLNVNLMCYSAGKVKWWCSHELHYFYIILTHTLYSETLTYGALFDKEAALLPVFKMTLKIKSKPC